MSSNDYHFSARTHRGRVRLANEDALAISTADCIEARCAGTIPNGGWALLADGMGGHAAGRIAGQLAIECLRSLEHRLHAQGGIEDAVAAANVALFTAMREDEALAGMGTTIAGVVLSQKGAVCFNVGDSRIYHHGKTLSLLSEDHVVDGHVLTQCLGGWNEADPPVPSIVEIEWKRSQRLLLCSDGLTDMLNDSEIAEILDRRGSSAAEALVDAALASGGHDNVTAIVIERLG